MCLINGLTDKLQCQQLLKQGPKMSTNDNNQNAIPSQTMILDNSREPAAPQASSTQEDEDRQSTFLKLLQRN